MKVNLQVISRDSTIKYMYLVEDKSDLKQQECPGGGILPIMAYTGRLRFKGAPFSGFEYMIGRVGISLVKVYDMVGTLNFVISVCKRH